MSTIADNKLLLEEKLIGFVHQRPFLYDMSHVDYRNSKAKELAWLKISELMENEEYSGIC